ncbi:C1 family peptidase [Nocardia aurantia]|uniref:Peptidase C1A papain C-terminal domain-containing protein n=1 Tax=Nocardia aurantia TaxID=2585199 RepID=A0A7K0DNB1_9NOCA|nr:C1 family peptidase [Nocardia aurantia]MQY27235.1 hypothetical protein [Nocardia aurantia]
MTQALSWLADLRDDMPAVGNQGTRPTCLSWATTTAHDRHRDLALSVEYLHWACGRTGRGTRPGLRRGLRDAGQPADEQWPYDPALTEDGHYQPPDTVTGPFHHAVPRAITRDPKRLVKQLDDGLLPVAVLRVTATFLKPAGGVVDGTDIGSGGHAVTVVAVAQLNSDVGTVPAGHHLVCVRNSWGPTWGQQGHALITERAWNACAQYAFVIEPTDT